VRCIRCVRCCVGWKPRLRLVPVSSSRLSRRSTGYLRSESLFFFTRLPSRLYWRRRLFWYWYPLPHPTQPSSTKDHSVAATINVVGPSYDCDISTFTVVCVPWWREMFIRCGLIVRIAIGCRRWMGRTRVWDVEMAWSTYDQCDVCWRRLFIGSRQVKETAVRTSDCVTLWGLS